MCNGSGSEGENLLDPSLFFFGGLWGIMHQDICAEKTDFPNVLKFRLKKKKKKKKK